LTEKVRKSKKGVEFLFFSVYDFNKGNRGFTSSLTEWELARLNCKKSFKKGGEHMKKTLIMFLVVSLLSIFAFGCVTKDYVKQQIDPLVDRISKLESRMSAVESRLNSLEQKVGSMAADIDQAKKDAASAKALAQDAMKKATECCDKAEAAAKRAEAAAARAEAAAARCEAAAAKEVKAFELKQKK
jgi:outer membrane murein-binding lipoprotein Lpp